MHAQRLNLPLATLDKELRVAGRALGIALQPSLRHAAHSTPDLIGKEAQPVGGSPSPQPLYLSHEYAGEGAELLTLPLPPRATKGPCVALGEGWGRSRAFEPHAASLRSGLGLPAQTRTASKGESSQQGLLLKLLANQDTR